MNTIKMYLATSGRIADLRKDFPLYQGQFQNKLLNVFVPTSILAPSFTSQSADGIVLADYVASTSVKIGMTYVSRDGSIKVSKNYYMRYLKTLTYQNVEYALYERKLPQEFTFYAGQGANAPTLIANVVNIEQDTENGEPKVISIITSQTCSLDVMPSTNLDKDESIEPSELDNITAQVNEINEILPTKQDKLDERLETTSKSVVGAINENKRNIQTNAGNIENNAEELAILRNEIDSISTRVGQQENYVGQIQGTSLPSNSALSNYVFSTIQRQPQNGDVVIFILYQNGTAVRNYKYTYYDNGWAGYQLVAISRSANGVNGTIQGTYGIESQNDTLVDISGGEIVNIYVKDPNNNYRNIREYLDTNAETTTQIINGDISVGLALKSIADKLGNDIVDTYLNKTEGATKNFVRDYAMPREFSSVYFISSSGYVPQVPTTPESGIQFSLETSAVGSFQLFQIAKGNEADFELTISNGYQNNIFVSASADCSVQFRLTTQYKKLGQNWLNLNVELSNPYELKADEIQKISFASPFTALGDNVIALSSGDQIRQTLEVVTQTSSTLTFNVYSNEIYPSIFSLTSQNYVARDVELVVGKSLAIGLDGTVEGDNAVFVVQNANDFIEYRTNQRRFFCFMNLPVVGQLADDIVVRIEFAETVYNLYSFEKGANTPLTIGDLKSVMAYNTNTGYSFFPELVFIENSDVVGFVIVPSTFTADQLINILGENGSVLPMANGSKIDFYLSAELTNKIGRALLTPTSAPPNTEIVAIDNQGNQEMLELGDSLTIQNGKLDVNAQLSGTVVTVGGTPQTTFNADTKLDVSTYNQDKATINQEIDDLQVDTSSLQNNVSTLQSDMQTAQQDISNNMGDIVALQEDKADKVANAILGNFASLTEQGNLLDSGVSKSNLYNPNLLINGDFRVNQRGQTTYDGSYRGYCVDRWFKNDGHTVTKGNGYITFTRNTTEERKYLLQLIEDYQNLLGKTITLSFKVRNGIVGKKYMFGLYNGSTLSATTGYYLGGEEIITTTLTVPNNWNTVGVVLYPIEETTIGASVQIEYIKAELGAIATPFIPRLYAEELELCQRYYLNFTDYLVCVGFSWGNTASSASIFIPTPIQLRTTPTINLNWGTFAFRDNLRFDIASLAPFAPSANGLRIRVTATSNYSADGQIIKMLVMGDIDAEIYF